MKFKVGPWIYRVRISEKTLQDECDGEMAGLCDWKNKTIWLSCDLPAMNRLPTLLHELRHAWDNEFGRAASPEDACNQAASFTADVWRQLAMQGGELALVRLTAGLKAPPCQGSDQYVGESYAVSCPRCGTMLASGSIITGVAHWDPEPE